MAKAIITIGVISDTHGLLRPAALAALKGSDFIIHAGDIGEPEILKRLEEVAPVTAVRGNVDNGSWAKTLPDRVRIKAGGVALYVIHNIEDLGGWKRPDAKAVVVFGHSHKPLNELRNDVLFFNPGSSGPRRFRLPISIGRLRIAHGKVKAEIVLIKP